MPLLRLTVCVFLVSCHADGLHPMPLAEHLQLYGTGA